MALKPTKQVRFMLADGTAVGPVYRVVSVGDNGVFLHDVKTREIEFVSMDDSFWKSAVPWPRLQLKED